MRAQYRCSSGRMSRTSASNSACVRTTVDESNGVVICVCTFFWNCRALIQQRQLLTRDAEGDSFGIGLVGEQVDNALADAFGCEWRSKTLKECLFADALMRGIGGCGGVTKLGGADDLLGQQHHKANAALQGIRLLLQIVRKEPLHTLRAR